MIGFMDEIFNLQSAILLDSVKSLILLGVILIVRTLLNRVVLRVKDLTAESRRRWMVGIRNILALVFLVGLIFIWAHELNTFAVSLVAIAVAIVLATKELILCVSGSIVRMRADAYALGDRIEIGAIRGKVLDATLLSTTVLEIGPGHQSQQYTGRVVVFPNSMLLATPVVNETYLKEYVLQQIRVPLSSGEDWQAAESALLEAAREECGGFLEEAQRQMQEVEGKTWLDAPSVEPRVTLQIPEAGKITLLLRYPSPIARAARLEQAILRRFLKAFPRGESRPVS